MAVIKCKMCGDALNVNGDLTICQCVACGSTQTVPNTDDEKKLAMLSRANRLMRNYEFDKAASVYENIFADFPEEPEAYWGNLLSKHGVEYLDNSETGTRTPICHRAGLKSFMKDPDFDLVMEYADAAARKIYRKQAKEIEENRKLIVEASSKAPSYEIYICHQETDSDGLRTEDSVIAQAVYDELTSKGYRVFFSRTSLGDKTRIESEHLIFAALNSAKFMLVFGTEYDYYNAVWVRNEWSRFLKMMLKNKKKHLIPCFKGLDDCDIPEEFAGLKTQDMGKEDFIQNIICEINNIAEKEDEETNAEEQKAQSQRRSDIAAFNKIAYMFLNEGDWNRAIEYSNKALDMDSKNVKAYLCRLMANLHVKTQEDLDRCQEPFDSLDEYQKLMMYGSDELKKQMKKCVQSIRRRTIDEKALEEELARDRQRRDELKVIAKDISKKILELYAYRGNEPTTSELLEQVKLEKQSALDKYNEQISFCEKLESEYPGIMADIDKLSKEKLSTSEEKRRLVEQLSTDEHEMNSLKLFSSGRKKELAAGIEETKNKISQLNQRVSELEAEIKNDCDKLEPLNTMEAIQNKLSQLRNEAERLTEQYNERIQHYELKLAEEKNALDKIIDAVQKEPDLKEYIEIGLKEFFSIPDGLCKVLDINPRFGSYPQESDGGQVAIGWKVLEKEENRIFVISKYAIDCMQFNIDVIDVTWSTCSLRKWLNQTFIDKAFNKEEQALIALSEVTADKNPSQRTDPGIDTTDKVFLLSINEAEKYFPYVEDKKCVPTAYALSQGASISRRFQNGKGDETCNWWLRTPGSNQMHAATVAQDGLIFYAGGYVQSDKGGVRPAMWINMEA